MNLRNKPLTRIGSETKYYPTPYECAALSYDTYKYSKKLVNNGGTGNIDSFTEAWEEWEIDPTYPELPPGWKTYAVSKCAETDTDHDFVGVCYIKYDPDPVAIVYASRGTVPTNLDNIQECLEIAFEKALHHFQYALSSYDEVYEKFRNDPNFRHDAKGETILDATLTFTGHSLGGVTSDFLLVNVYGGSKSITFENPGSYPCLLDYLKTIFRMDERFAQEFLQEISQQSHNYLSNVDIFNTCNKHLGAVFRLKNMLVDYCYNSVCPIIAIPQHFLDNDYYIFTYSLDQHQIKKICDYLKNNGLYEIDDNQPIGFQAGYVDYLWLEKHIKYWEGYLSYYWDQNPLIHDRFKNKEDFTYYCYNTVKNMHELASKLLEKPEHKSDPTPFRLFSPKLNIDDFALINKSDMTDKNDQEKLPERSCLII